MIISFILMTLICNSSVILFGEIRYQPLLGVKVLIETTVTVLKEEKFQDFEI